MSQSPHVVTVTTETFDTAVLESTKPVVVDFWAAWCGPCVRMAPTYAEVAAETPAVTFASVDVDADPELAQRFGVVSIPTLAFFRNGALVGRHVGSLSKDQLRQAVEQAANVGVAV